MVRVACTRGLRLAFTSPGQPLKTEPKTDAEFEQALEKLGYEIVDHRDHFTLRKRPNGLRHRLEARNRSSAYLEGWEFVKNSAQGAGDAGNVNLADDGPVRV